MFEGTGPGRARRRRFNCWTNGSAWRHELTTFLRAFQENVRHRHRRSLTDMSLRVAGGSGPRKPSPTPSTSSTWFPTPPGNGYDPGPGHARPGHRRTVFTDCVHEGRASHLGSGFESYSHRTELNDFFRHRRARSPSTSGPNRADLRRIFHRNRCCRGSGLASGYEKSIGKQLDVMGVDVVVSDMSGGFMPKAFDASLQLRIAKLPRVAETTSVLMEMQSIEDAPMMMVSGREWGGFTWGKLNLLSGRMPRDGKEHAVILGRMAAEVLKKKVRGHGADRRRRITGGWDRRWPRGRREWRHHAFPGGATGGHRERWQGQLH